MTLLVHESKTRVPPVYAMRRDVRVCVFACPCTSCFAINSISFQSRHTHTRAHTKTITNISLGNLLLQFSCTRTQKTHVRHTSARASDVIGFIVCARISFTRSLARFPCHQTCAHTCTTTTTARARTYTRSFVCSLCVSVRASTRH